MFSFNPAAPAFVPGAEAHPVSGAPASLTDVLDADILSLILELVPTPARAARVSWS